MKFNEIFAGEVYRTQLENSEFIKVEVTGRSYCDGLRFITVKTVDDGRRFLLSSWGSETGLYKTVPDVPVKVRRKVVPFLADLSTVVLEF